MPTRRRFGLVLVVVLCAAACGGNGTSTTTAPSTTTTSAPSTTTSTTSTSTTSTTAPDSGPLASLLADPVADPLLGTGVHSMEYGDEAGTYLVSVDALTPSGGRLLLAPYEPPPASTGIGPDQVLLEAWVEPAAEVAPRAMVLYGLGVGGWNPYVTISAADVLAYLDTTTDYQARRPDDPADVRVRPTSFTWAGSARFTADVTVFAYPNSTDPAYSGEIECVFIGTLECETTSDDGVLRLGDEGEDVAALQAALAALGYYGGAGEGAYEEETEQAVRLFQRDYRLAVDGRAGPQTQSLLDEVASGESDIVLASREGVGEVAFGTPAAEARAALTSLFGSPDDATGWFPSPCSGADWQEITWDGFTAVFTDRNGSRQFDGWEVDDLQDLPDWLYFAGGIRPTWRWADFEDMGARFDFDPDGVAFWYHGDLGYNNGRFVNPPAATPAENARIRSFGTGTGAFVSC